MPGRQPVQFGQRGSALLRAFGAQVLETLGVGHRIMEKVDHVGGGAGRLKHAGVEPARHPVAITTIVRLTASPARNPGMAGTAYR